MNWDTNQPLLYNMPTITGIYTENDAHIGHLHSTVLANKLLTLLNKDSIVLDFGCGRGEYLKFLQSEGYNVIGVDGINISNEPFIETFDISQKIELGLKGSVISLEVGEHIPNQFEKVFIENLITHCDMTLVLSWAVEGQPGIGHINCRNNEYIISQLKDYNFEFDMDTSNFLREDIESHCNYFKNTLMVFRKKYD